MCKTIPASENARKKHLVKRVGDVSALSLSFTIILRGNRGGSCCILFADNLDVIGVKHFNSDESITMRVVGGVGVVYHGLHVEQCHKRLRVGQAIF